MAILDREYFDELKNVALNSLKSHEYLFLSLDGESSQFMRVNAGKVRQTGLVDDAQLSFAFVSDQNGGLRKISRTISLSGDAITDASRIQKSIDEARSESRYLPVDPFAVLPKNYPASITEKKGNLLSPFETANSLLSSLQNIDLVGLYASGTLVRAFANSAGLTHWFKTDSFLFDYSLFTKEQRALKGVLGGQTWNEQDYQNKIKEEGERLSFLENKPKKLTAGEYRVYLAPHAVADLISMLSWGGVSEAAIQQGDSPFRKIRSGEKKFSPLFNLTENFSEGTIPRWNEEGALAPEVLEIVSEGLLKNSLVNSRSEKEYKVKSNAANGGEGLRSPFVSPGKILESEISKELGTGVYISNLHYLNWSDQPQGRITGMTRYACFWVENGQLQGPIENMRFDETIFRLFGSELLGLTTKAFWIPEVGTYGMRSLGGSSLPGILVSRMKFTL
ncbi:MAG: hypothetical protein JWQ35_2174 [Bacteriovoracaceae bacterium]|nr:hypothetical protein [Bacteriovoracaceae bacterium]